MKLHDIKVLLIEDDVNVRATLKAFLNEMGMANISEFGDGREAQKFMENEPDNAALIICDWNMPYKTGVEFFREIRQVYPTLPFIMVTARADKQSILTAKELNFTAYITKPVSYDVFKEKVLSSLGMFYG
jgi:CheY-like chemotaxis protein